MQSRMKLPLILLPLLLLCGCATSTPAEQEPGKPSVSALRDPVVEAYVAQIRAELSSGKVNMINEIMKLSPSEAAAFWPAYSDYEQDLFALGDRRLELIKKFMDAQDGRKLDNTTADSLASDWLKLQRDAADLMQLYYKRLSKEVSPLHAAQFLQIEHRTNTVIDLVIAAEMPLVMQPGSGPNGGNR